MTTGKIVSSYQQDIQRFRRYSAADARAHIALQLASEAGELAGWFGKRLYKPVDPMNLIEELGDVRHYLAQLCTEVGLQLDEIKPRFAPEWTFDHRLLRIVNRAARMGECLLMEYRSAWFYVEIGYLLTDLDVVMAVVANLTEQTWTWADIEAANVRKLAGDPSKAAAL